MFSRLTRQLREEIRKIESVIDTNDQLRGIVFSQALAHLRDQRANEQALLAPHTIQGDEERIHELFGSSRESPCERVDWQIHDHCAAFIRMYAAFERYINDLVTSYVESLPSLYHSYEDLPEAVSSHHRNGVGQILQKIGPKKTYRKLEEDAVIEILSSRLGDNAPYKLMPEAFLVEKQNYRFEVIVNIFSTVGIEGSGKWIVNHPSITEFFKSTRGEADTPQAELAKFVDNRNEAAHGIVENIVSVEEIMKIGTFLQTL